VALLSDDVYHLVQAAVEVVDLLVAEVIDHAGVELVQLVEIFAIEHVLVVTEDAHDHCCAPVLPPFPASS